MTNGKLDSDLFGSVNKTKDMSIAGGVSRLEISSLRDSDAGDYVCQLSLLAGLLSLQHTLDVLGLVLSC